MFKVQVELQRSRTRRVSHACDGRITVHHELSHNSIPSPTAFTADLDVLGSVACLHFLASQCRTRTSTAVRGCNYNGTAGH